MVPWQFTGYSIEVYVHYGALPLKVGSCPTNDSSVKIFFCPFLRSI